MGERDASRRNSKLTTRSGQLRTSVQASEVRDIHIHEQRKSGLVWGVALVLIVLVLIGYYGWYSNGWFVAPDADKYVAWLQRGDSLVTVNSFENARQAYRKANRYSPGDSTAQQKFQLVDQAIGHLKAENFGQARSILTAVLMIPVPEASALKSGVPSGSVSTAERTKTMDRAFPVPSPESDRSKNDDSPHLQAVFAHVGSSSLEIAVEGGEPRAGNTPYAIVGLDESVALRWQKTADGHRAFLSWPVAYGKGTLRIEDQAGGYVLLDLPASGMEFNQRIEHLRTRAIKAFRSGELDSAQIHFTQLLVLVPEDTMAIARLKDIRYELGRLTSERIEMIHIKGGIYEMGNDAGARDEQPAHRVKLPPFYVSRYPVLLEEYQGFCTATGRDAPEEPKAGWRKTPDGREIITNITYNDALAFSLWANGSLISEAEYECIARQEESPEMPLIWPRIQYWCADYYAPDYYQHSILFNPRGPENGSDRVVRGPSSPSLSIAETSSSRSHREEGFSSPSLGFHIVRSRPPVIPESLIQ